MTQNRRLAVLEHRGEALHLTGPQTTAVTSWGILCEPVPGTLNWLSFIFLFYMSSLLCRWDFTLLKVLQPAEELHIRHPVNKCNLLCVNMLLVPNDHYTCRGGPFPGGGHFAQPCSLQSDKPLPLLRMSLSKTTNFCTLVIRRLQSSVSVCFQSNWKLQTSGY